MKRAYTKPNIITRVIAPPSLMEGSMKTYDEEGAFAGAKESSPVDYQDDFDDSEQ